MATLTDRCKQYVTEQYEKNGFDIEQLDEEFIFSLFKQGVTHRIQHYKYNKRIRTLAKLAKEHGLE